MESFMAGTLAGTGSFRCARCDYILALAADDALSDCPRCGGTEFSRASLFTTVTDAAAPPATVESDETGWLNEVRAGLAEPGQYLAYRDGDHSIAVPLTREWTRIGRSLAADVRFDDPTVSRRHALVARRAEGIQVLDDRSLNGVWVNGDRVEGGALSDGDEIVIGRHRLRFLDVPHVSGVREMPLGADRTALA